MTREDTESKEPQEESGRELTWWESNDSFHTDFPRLLAQQSSLKEKHALSLC